jgi:hypothetical protein
MVVAAFVTELALFWLVKMIGSLVVTVKYIALPPVETRVTKEDSDHVVLPGNCAARVAPVIDPCAEFLS